MGAANSLAANEGAELVRRCRAGDGAAWEEIVQIYSRRIYNLAYRFTSRADAAEDLTQEVFVRVFRSLSQYDAKQGDLQNWLMRLARNLIIDDYRRRQRSPHDSHADDLEDHTYHLHNVGNSVQREMERRELGAQVQAG
ncbi:MAG: sigma-70 family RNA polymerase sigma factor, partial [Pyrinomonadaceae bacterium]